MIEGTIGHWWAEDDRGNNRILIGAEGGRGNNRILVG